MALWRLMACLAHPDDECFSMAGILASSTAQGVAVELICATRGEAGDIRMPGSATPETLGDVRHQELRASCNVLGIAEPIMLGYRDSGWGDDPAQRHPQAFVNALDRDVVQQLVAEFRRFRPHVILTFEPGGLSGHKDHIAMSKHATFAYQVAGDPHAFPEQLQDGLAAWAPQRLLYVARPQGSRLERARRLREAGVNVPLPPPETWSQGVPLEQIHLTLDVSEQLPTKLASLRCHRTQASPEMDPIDWSQGSLAEMYSTEYLIQADPPVPEGATIDPDIFAGLNAE
jgi:LmbE family N-acetylglucosaminyl deacetylase